MALTSGRAAQYRDAGYTHYVEFEIFVRSANVWALSGYPTTEDALALHRRGLAGRVASGEIRDPQIIDIRDPRAALRIARKG